MSLSLPLVLAALASPAYAEDGDPVPAWVDALPVPTMQLQVWGTAWDQDEDAQADPSGWGDPEDDPGFKFRRARVGLEGRYAFVDYSFLVGADSPFDQQQALALGTAAGRINLIAAQAAVNARLGPGALRVSTGLQRLPYSREALISSRHLVFQDRSVHGNSFAPGRDMGVVVDYALDFGLRLRAGAFNGNMDLTGDDNPGLMTTARLEYALGDVYRTRGEGPAVGIGVSMVHNPALATESFILGADALVRVGPVCLLLDGGRAVITPTDTDVAPPDVFANTERWGGMAQLSGFLDLGTAGQLEPALRLSFFDDDSDQSDNGDVGELMGGLSFWDDTHGVSVGAGYVHRLEFGGRALNNDTIRVWLQLSPDFSPRGPLLGGLWN